MKSVYYYLSVLIIFLSACHTNKSELETIKVAQFGDVFIYIPLYLANTKGFFKEEGLKVDLINTGGDDKTYALVVPLYLVLQILLLLLLLRNKE